MSQTIDVPRELLERVIGEGAGTSLNAMRELRAILAAPRQPEGEGLGVVAWFDTQNKGYLTDDKDRASTWVHEGFSVGQLCRLSDAQRTIAELRDERDTLLQQLDERDATIERLEAGIPRLQEQSFQMRQQRDKLAGLLREAHSAGRSRRLTVDELYRIDAALAEVKPCLESPAPTT